MPDPHPLPVVPAVERRIIGEDLKTLQFRWPLKTQKTPLEEKALALKRKNAHRKTEEK